MHVSRGLSVLGLIKDVPGIPHVLVNVKQPGIKIDIYNKPLKFDIKEQRNVFLHINSQFPCI